MSSWILVRALPERPDSSLPPDEDALAMMALYTDGAWQRVEGKGWKLSFSAIRLYARPNDPSVYLAVAVEPGSYLLAPQCDTVPRVGYTQFVFMQGQKLTLRLDWRCPLMFADGNDVRSIGVTFTFRQASFVSPEGFVADSIEIDPREFGAVRGGRPLAKVFGAANATADDPWLGVFDHVGPPALLDEGFSALVEEKGAGGSHNRSLFIKYMATGVYTLALNYTCHDWHAASPKQAPRLWPLGIAPRGLRGTSGAHVDLHAYGHDVQGWGEPNRTWVLEGNSDASDGAPFPFPACEIRTAWNERIVAPYERALRTVRAGSPVSILPFFYAVPNAQRWTQTWLLDDAPKTTRARRWTATFRSLAPVLADGERLAVDVLLRNFLDHDQQPIFRQLLLGAGDPKIDAHLNFSVEEHTQLTGPSGSARPVARIGALDVQLGLLGNPQQGGRQARKDADFLRCWLDGLGDSERRVRPAREPWLTLVEAQTSFLVDAFGPGDQDLTPVEARDRIARPPTIVVAPDDRSRIAGRFFLIASEDSRAPDHVLKLDLYNETDGGSEAAIDLIVIDTQPFLVARVRADLRLGALRGELGTWSEAAIDGASWELYDAGDAISLLLPPQAVGEEFIKRYRAPWQPDARPIGYRFSPPALLQLSRAAFKQRYSEAPWNVRRLLGWSKEREPGAPARSLRFELLYGLTTTVTAAQTWLAEAGARLGLPPPPIDLARDHSLGVRPEPKSALAPSVAAAWAAWAERGNAQLALLRGRLALLVPWSPLQPAADFALDHDVQFQFRGNRVAADPITPLAPAEGYHKVADGGLRGGVDWGFESRNILDEVIVRPSSSGKIVNPSFTALGGSGFQKASFANDKSTIYSDTWLGRTFFYSLERIGRVGMLWNRAKHVIIYERSAADSAQFPDRDGAWVGWPVGRKTREFVEILQPERSYPESGEAPQARGFVLGSRFVDTIIPVDSQWGRDVPGGWVVPLHLKPEEIPDNADYYRHEPDVMLRLATSADTGSPHRFARVTNPEHLLFYTSTDPAATADTDAWPPAAEIDFPLAEIPTVEPAVPTTGDARLPDPPPVHPSYERHTLHLDTGGQSVNLLEGRLSSVAEAVVENVSVVRRSARKWSPPPALDQLAQAARAGEQLAASLADTIAALTAGLPGSLAAPLDVAKLAGQVREACQKLQAGAAGTLDVLLDLQRAAAGDFAPADTWAAALADARAQLARELGRPAAEDEAATAAIAQALLGTRTRLLAARLVHHEALAQADRVAADLRGALADALPELERLRGALADAIARRDLGGYRLLLLDGLRSLVAAVGAHLPKLGTAFPLPLDGGAARSSDYAFALSALAAAFDAQSGLFPDDPPPPSAPPAQVEAWFQKVALAPGAFDGVVDALSTLADEAQARADELGDATDDLEADLDDIIDDALLLAVTPPVPRLDDAGEPRPPSEKLLDLAAALRKLPDPERAVELIAGKLGEALAGVREYLQPTAPPAKVRNYASVVDALGDGEALLGAVLGDVARAGRWLDVDELKEAVFGPLRAVLEAARRLVGAADARLLALLGDLVSSSLSSLAGAVAPHARLLAQKLASQARALADQARDLGGAMLRLVRAFGQAPIAEAMRLSRDRLAYFFHDAAGELHALKNAVDFTPSVVLVNRLGRELEQIDLKSLGLRLPSASIAERFLPRLGASLPRLGDILPDFAGINLEKLLQVELPSEGSDAIHVTHGINRVTRQAWAQCDVNLPLGGEKPVFAIGPVQVTLGSARLEAHSRIAVGLGGGMQRQVEAFATGDWGLLVGGQRIATLRETVVRFGTDGRLSFDIRPQNIVLADALRFLTDLLRGAPGNHGGLTFELMRAGELPIGVRALLKLALPAIQTGAFAVSNLALMASFELSMPSSGFEIAVALSLADRDRPFNISVLFLGGGGWITTRALYRPFRGELEGHLSIGLAVGASLFFDIGVASGGAWLFLSISVEWSFGGGAGQLALILRITLGGELCILGLITVSLLMELEARYADGTLTCTGTLRMKIEIGWFFSIEVEEGFTYTLARSGGGQTQSVSSYSSAFGD